VGENGTILHYDGASWTVVTPPANTPTLQTVWGTSSSNVYAVGGPSATDPLGTIPMILHYNGTSWNSQPASQKLHGLWGSGENDIFVSGRMALSCTSMEPVDRDTAWPDNSYPPQHLGSTSGNVLVVGDFGTVLRYDGSNWSVMPSGTTEGLFCIWGSSSPMSMR